jgi:selenide,water dikinase
MWRDGGPLVAEANLEDGRDLLASLACDAQTSGGLLLCVPPATVAACLAALHAEGLPAAAIGELRTPDARAMIELA